jgi:hypothetical protein
MRIADYHHDGASESTSLAARLMHIGFKASLE